MADHTAAHCREWSFSTAFHDKAKDKDKPNPTPPQPNNPPPALHTHTHATSLPFWDFSSGLQRSIGPTSDSQPNGPVSRVQRCHAAQSYKVWDTPQCWRVMRGCKANPGQLDTVLFPGPVLSFVMEDWRQFLFPPKTFFRLDSTKGSCACYVCGSLGFNPSTCMATEHC